MRELYAQDGSLHRVQPAIDSQQLVFVLGAAAVDAHQLEACGDSIVIGGDHAAVTAAAQVLGREEAEAADRADAAGHSAFVFRADGLGCVLDYRKIVLRGDCLDGIHVRRQPKQVDWDDRLGTGRDRRFQSGRIEIVGNRIDIDEHGPRIQTRDRTSRSHKRERRSNNFVAGTDTERHQRQQQGIGTRSATKRMPYTDVACHFALQRGYFRAEDEVL